MADQIMTVDKRRLKEILGIQDGDTLTLLVDRAPLRIRLADIDAPEKKQAFGQRAKQSLSDMYVGKNATYRTQTIDKYGSTVAHVTCAGIDANRAQVGRGMAWVYDKYNKDSSLPSVQAAASTASLAWKWRRWPHPKSKSCRRVRSGRW